MTEFDPEPSSAALRTGHRNRGTRPFNLRQRGASSFSDWMPTVEGKDRTRSRSAAVGGHRRRARPIRRSAVPVRPGLRLGPAPHLVATTVDARLCATPGGLVPAAARLPARSRLGVSARAKVQRQAGRAAVATENRRLTHPTDPNTIRLARLKRLSFTLSAALTTQPKVHA
jgi:hypothetical protein